jgi:hypothetical protein
MVTAQPRRRWPLLAIGASAGTATWSGWVGLGQLTGFGIVHPLPGIWDQLTVNTAVTLPVGVEAYAMYALSMATTSRPLADRTRRYAWASSAAALLLGMAGQIAYHVMTARQPDQPPTSSRTVLAPWWVIALVSCLPVLVLGAASLLWHLAGADPVPIPVPGSEPLTGSDPIPEAAADPIHHPIPDPPAQVPILGSDRPGPVQIPEPGSPLAVESGEPKATRRDGSPALCDVTAARPRDVALVRAAIAARDLPARPSASAIRAHLKISPAYARAARDAITAHPPRPLTPPERGAGLTQTRKPNPYLTPAPIAEPEATEQPEPPFHEPISPVQKKAQPSTRPVTEGMPKEKREEVQTYAVGLP